MTRESNSPKRSSALLSRPPKGTEHRLARENGSRRAWLLRQLPPIYAVIVFLFLYAPMMVMIVFSLNGKNSTSAMDWNLTLRWYKEFFDNSEYIPALRNTLMLALISSAISTLIGTSAAVALDSWKKKFTRGAILSVTDIPMMAPDIVTGISMMLLFVYVGRLIWDKGVLGFPTLLIAHVTFCLPYVILSVLPRLRQTDRHLAEAAQDLGCTPAKAFWKVVLPNILPAILTGALMAFTLSLDDFVISYFTKGSGYNTLPTVIYAATKRPVRPTIFAMSTMIFVGIFVLLLLINAAQTKSDKKLQGAKK